MLQKSRVPASVAQGNAAEVVLGVGRVNRDDIEVLILRGDDAAFGVRVAISIGQGIFGQEGFGEIMTDAVGLDFAEQSRAGVAFFDCGIQRDVVFGQVEDDILGLGFGFLETENVGLFGIHEGIKYVFTQHGTDAVDIPRIQFHTG